MDAFLGPIRVIVHYFSIQIWIMKTLPKHLILFFFLLLANLLLAQSEQIFFEQITTRDGLSQNDINDIYQDSRGFMWFGTNEGLNKYDGYSFTIYKPDPNTPGAINSNLAFTITEDQNADLWIGTTGSGINHFDREKERFTSYLQEPGNKNSLISDHVTTIHADEQGFLWVGTRAGLCYLDLNQKEKGFTHVEFHDSSDGSNNLYVNALYDDGKGNLWVGSNQGLWQLTGTNETTSQHVQKIPVRGPEQLDRVTSISADKFGALVIGTTDGLFYQTEKGFRNKFMQFSDQEFRSIQVDEKNQIWVGSNVGLFCFKSLHQSSLPAFVAQYTNNPIDPNSLSKDVIRVIFTDQTGIIWVGTNGGGLNKFFPKGKSFRVFRKTYQKESLSYNKIRALFEDSNGTLWIGTEGGGLNFLPSKAGEADYKRFQHIAFPKKPFALEEILLKGRKTLLIGAEGLQGFFIMDIEGSIAPNPILKPVPSEQVDGFVFSLLEDFRGRVWIGTYQNGLYCWNPNAKNKEEEWRSFQHKPSDDHSLSNDIIRKIFEDSKGNIWIGTGKGLNKISAEEALKSKPRFERFLNDPSDSSSISHDYILDIFEGEDEKLWIGTFGGGLNQLNLKDIKKREHFKSFSLAEGLPNQVIKAIQEDDTGTLWVSSNRGLSKYDPISGIFTNYDEHDGLQSTEFSEIASLRRSDGEILFGGVNGFNAFYPNQIHRNKKRPQITFSKLLVSNKPVEVGMKVKGHVILPEAITELEELKLRSSENSFSIEFAALHYAAPAKNRYAYRLEGFDQDWIQTESDRRYATYTNLSPGSYTLMIKASNNDDLWNEVPKQLKIIIIPPIWRRWYAFLFYFLVLVGLMLLFRKYTIIGIHEKHQLVLEKWKNEQAEEISKLKLQFFTNISHELRTPLTLIKGPLDNLIANDTIRQYPSLLEKVNMMHKNTRYLLRLLNQLLAFRKMDQGKVNLSLQQADIVAFIHNIVDTFQTLAKSKNIEIEIHKTTEKILLWFDPSILEKVLYNLLSNAFKFTPKDGRIVIKMATVFEDKKQNEQHRPLQHYFELSILDSGPGIAPEHVEHIFERFYQGEENQQTGAGIGLAFSKSLLEVHQGEIHLRNRNGEGACFQVKLPLENHFYENAHFITDEAFEPKQLTTAEEYFIHDVESSQDSHVIPLHQQLADAGQLLPCLLIIDDNPDIRSYLRREMDSHFRVIEAKDGQEGYEKVHSDWPDIVLCDVKMPVLDGISFCSKIKSDDQTSHIQVILLSAKSTEESELEGRKSGADAYMKKPFNVEILRLKLINSIQLRDKLKMRFRTESILEPSDIPYTSPDEAFLQSAMEIIENGLSDSQLNVELIAKELGISRSKLYVSLKTLTGQSPNELVRTIRLKRAAQLMERGDYSIKEVMALTGFNTASYFSKCFKKQFGVLPSEYTHKLKIEHS